MSARSLLRDTACCFTILCILLFPFPLHLLPFQVHLAEGLMGGLVGKSLREFGIRDNGHMSSDTAGLWALGAWLLLFSILLAGALARVAAHRNRLFAFTLRVAALYLCARLLLYGMDKVFKAQFYLPEPNTLYTPLGQMDRDLLYWSTMGSSYPYNLFLGCTEVLAAVLLFFRRTRLAGALLSLSIVLQIVAVNFCFDISVKFLSLFLLFLCLLVLYPGLRPLYWLLFLHRPAQLPVADTQEFGKKHPALRTTLRTFLGLLLITEALYPVLAGAPLNDDLAARPPLHGAYEVLPGSRFDTVYKRVFIHRDGFLVLQDRRDRMQDYRLQLDTPGHRLVLTGYDGRRQYLPYTYDPADSLLGLQFPGPGGLLKARALNWRSLPLLRPQFHWVAD